jgi:hypothetical protein
MDIENRLARLERSNRRWRWCAAALLGVVGLGGLTAMHPLGTRGMSYRPSVDRGGDRGFAIVFPGSEMDVRQQQVGMLAEADAAQSRLIVELSAAVKDCERRISTLERAATPVKAEPPQQEKDAKAQTARP